MSRQPHTAHSHTSRYQAAQAHQAEAHKPCTSRVRVAPKPSVESRRKGQGPQQFSVLEIRRHANKKHPRFIRLRQTVKRGTPKGLY